MVVCIKNKWAHSNVHERDRFRCATLCLLFLKLIVRLPDGSPAADVPVKVDVATSSEKSWQGSTNQEGAVFPVFNLNTGAQITVEVSILKQLKR